MGEINTQKIFLGSEEERILQGSELRMETIIKKCLK
jgi:hypothetical protein